MNPSFSVIVGSTREGPASRKKGPRSGFCNNLGKARGVVDARAFFDLRDFPIAVSSISLQRPAMPGRAPYKERGSCRDGTAAISRRLRTVFGPSSTSPNINYGTLRGASKKRDRLGLSRGGIAKAVGFGQLWLRHGRTPGRPAASRETMIELQLAPDFAQSVHIPCRHPCGLTTRAAMSTLELAELEAACPSH